LDGENTTMYRDHIHARSLDSGHHPSRSWVKQLHSQICQDIPEGYRISGENMFAKHSIHYHNLKSFFYIFGMWNKKNALVSWDETIEWAQLLSLPTPRILYRGVFDEELIKNLYTPTLEGDECEGYVLRYEGEISMRDFSRMVLKYVRKGHIQTNQHWANTYTVKNELSSPDEHK
jgi:hypothetical protein